MVLPTADKCIDEPVENRILTVPSSTLGNSRQSVNKDDAYGHEGCESNRSCVIILGIGGKMEKLVNIPAAKRDDVLTIRRFSGGGTVVVDHNSLWTTFIGRNDAPMLSSGECMKPFPREIMAWSADLFKPAFRIWNQQIMDQMNKNGMRRSGRQTLVFAGKSCGLSGGVGESLILPPKNVPTSNDKSNLSRPKFELELRENDYVFGERKMGGNAQSIVNTGFLHHTSFLWDYDASNMEYLNIPEKRPNYRGDRSHDDFLVKLKKPYGNLFTKNEFFDQVKAAAGQTYCLEESSLEDVLVIAKEKFGSLQHWYDGSCRTRIERYQSDIGSK